ncbi:MAG: hypothetical protein ACR2J9_13180 [Gaiellales bacterium]
MIDADARRTHGPALRADADFDRRDALSGATDSGRLGEADLVLLSEPSSDTAILQTRDEAEQWPLVSERIRAARSVTARGGRTIFVLPTHMLDARTEQSNAMRRQPDAAAERREWSADLEAVIEVPTSRSPVSSTMLIFHPGGSRKREERVLFASLVPDCDSTDGVRQLLQVLRSELWSPTDILSIEGVARTSALIERADLMQGDGNLSPQHWWRVAFANHTEQLDALLADDQHEFDRAIRRTERAIDAAARFSARAERPLPDPVVWIPLRELEDAELIHSIAATPQPMPVRREIGEPLLRLDRGAIASPLDVEELQVGIDEVRPESRLEEGDVVFWHASRSRLSTRIIDGGDRLALLRPGRALRITTRGRRAGLSPALLAFALETSATTTARSSSIRSSATLGFPVASAEQPLPEAIGWASATFGDLADSIAELRRLELEATALAQRTAALRRDAAVFGSTGAVRARLGRAERRDTAP